MMPMQKKRKTVSWTTIVLLMLCSGCAAVHGYHPDDPWESWNRGVQSFNDDVDAYMIKPVAVRYEAVMPSFAHHAVTNFFSNIDDIGVSINDALQGKYRQSAMDTARLLVNTTAGAGGLIDVGSMISLPKHYEDFEQTLGWWGVYSGPYLVLPLFGSSSPRGVAGLLGDAAMNPVSYTGIYFNGSVLTALAVSGGAAAVNTIDTRANSLMLEKVINEAAIDRYQFLKNAYWQRRDYLLHDGNVPDADVLNFQE